MFVLHKNKSHKSEPHTEPKRKQQFKHCWERGDKTFWSWTDRFRYTNSPYLRVLSVGPWTQEITWESVLKPHSWLHFSEGR